MKEIGHKFYTEKPIVISAKTIHYIRVGAVLIIGILYTWFHSYLNTHGGEFGIFNSFLYYPFSLISTLVVSLVYALLLKLAKPSYSKDTKAINKKYIPAVFAIVGIALLLGYRYFMPLLLNIFSKSVYVYVSYYVLIALILLVSITVVLISLSMSDWNNLLLIICIGTGLLWSLIGVRLPMLRAEQKPIILNFFKTVSPVIVSCLPVLVYEYRKFKMKVTP